MVLILVFVPFFFYSLSVPSLLRNAFKNTSSIKLSPTEVSFSAAGFQFAFRGYRVQKPAALFTCVALYIMTGDN